MNNYVQRIISTIIKHTRISVQISVYFVNVECILSYAYLIVIVRILLNDNINIATGERVPVYQITKIPYRCLQIYDVVNDRCLRWSVEKRLCLRKNIIRGRQSAHDSESLNRVQQ